MDGEIGKFCGVPVIENKYLPKDTILIIGTVCRYCGLPWKSAQQCTNPEGHLPQYRFVKVK